jgi:hypothetical protein
MYGAVDVKRFDDTGRGAEERQADRYVAASEMVSDFPAVAPRVPNNN